MDSAMTKIDRRPSIEKEPRTLSLAQIQYAREEALYVMNTKTVDEAMRIFTQGLQPVPSIIEDSSELQEGDQFRFSIPMHEDFRDIVSAPF